LRRRGHDVDVACATRRACSVEAILLDSKTGFRAGATGAAGTRW
jgi:hypothetical protein